MTKKQIEQQAEEYRNSRKSLQYFSESYKEKIEQAYIAGAESRQPEIDNLSKHILELQNDKGRMSDENRQLENDYEMIDNCNRIHENELTKAKEIIKEFMRISVASVEEYEPEFSELIDRAEQFLGDEKC